MYRYSKKIISLFVTLTLMMSSVIAPPNLAAQNSVVPLTGLNLPQPGTMVSLSSDYQPAVLKGITIHPNNPFVFDFVVDPGDSGLQGEDLSKEMTKLVKYFLASLAIPNEELWVNLSPYEQNRIIPEKLGYTDLGKELLAQDYLLKQITASLIYPEDDLGQEFWNKVFQHAEELYGTTDIPLNTFNKVWIMPEEAVVVQNGNTAYVIESRLKVMLEEDFLALNKNMGNATHGLDILKQKEANDISDVTSQAVKEIVLPILEQEINHGKNFAPLRQIYRSHILASWYKQNLKNSMLGQLYANQKKVEGIDIEDKEVKQKVYEQYLQAYQRGVYNYIKEDFDAITQQLIPRKYFSGGVVLDDEVAQINDISELGTEKITELITSHGVDMAMRYVLEVVKKVGFTNDELERHPWINQFIRERRPDNIDDLRRDITIEVDGEDQVLEDVAVVPIEGFFEATGDIGHVGLTEKALYISAEFMDESNAILHEAFKLFSWEGFLGNKKANIPFMNRLKTHFEARGVSESVRSAYESMLVMYHAKPLPRELWRLIIWANLTTSKRLNKEFREQAQEQYPVVAYQESLVKEAELVDTHDVTIAGKPILELDEQDMLVVKFAPNETGVELAERRKIKKQTLDLYDPKAEIAALIDRDAAGRVSEISVAIGRYLGLEEEQIDRIWKASMLHDIARRGADFVMSSQFTELVEMLGVKKEFRTRRDNFADNGYTENNTPDAIFDFLNQTINDAYRAKLSTLDDGEKARFIELAEALGFFTDVDIAQDQWPLMFDLPEAVKKNIMVFWNHDEDVIDVIKSIQTDLPFPFTGKLEQVLGAFVQLSQDLPQIDAFDSNTILEAMIIVAADQIEFANNRTRIERHRRGDEHAHHNLNSDGTAKFHLVDERYSMLLQLDAYVHRDIEHGQEVFDAAVEVFLNLKDYDVLTEVIEFGRQVPGEAGTGMILGKEIKDLAKAHEDYHMISTATKPGTKKKEDRRVNRLISSDYGRWRVMAVLDGRWGTNTVDFVKTKLTRTIEDHIIKNEGNIDQAIKDAVEELQVKIGKKFPDDEESGTTMALVVMREDPDDENEREAYRAILGDSIVLLRDKDGVVHRSHIHNTLWSESEKSAADTRGAALDKDDYLHLGGGNLKTHASRLLGSTGLGNVVNRKPEVHRFILGKDSYVLLSTDGAYDKSDKTVDAVFAPLEQLMGDPFVKAQDIVDYSAERGIEDDAEAVVWRFGGNKVFRLDRQPEHGGIYLGEEHFMQIYNVDSDELPVYSPSQWMQFQENFEGVIPIPVGTPVPTNPALILGISDPLTNFESITSLSRSVPHRHIDRF